MTRHDALITQERPVALPERGIFNPAKGKSGGGATVSVAGERKAE